MDGEGTHKEVIGGGTALSSQDLRLEGRREIEHTLLVVAHSHLQRKQDIGHANALKQGTASWLLAKQ